MIKTMFSCIKVLAQCVKWILQFRTKKEAEIRAYFTDERAYAWRLKIEKALYAIKTGDPVLLDRFPRWLRWLFARTIGDNHIARFWLLVLKSKKLSENDPILKGK